MHTVHYHRMSVDEILKYDVCVHYSFRKYCCCYWIQVRVTLRQTVSQSVRPPWCRALLDTYGFVRVRRPL
jgi:hypothetical protein